ncbi:hypothetical protein EVAR_37425_1 [Eumeta japonica]|uniref:Uncharacterized protein n=1 Tax=Eumeta variegata TaxID=151549 RepID=A0A4C1WEX0_EUMVA|nr:hypothetical protein EVAR_37425_1 [Eumeta japonica]
MITHPSALTIPTIDILVHRFNTSTIPTDSSPCRTSKAAFLRPAGRLAPAEVSLRPQLRLWLGLFIFFLGTMTKRVKRSFLQLATCFIASYARASTCYYISY